MKKQLEEICGITLDTPPVTLEWVGDLLFFEWSLISVLKNQVQKPFLKIWVEGDEDINRYAIFEIEQRLLEGYLFGVTTYLEVISNPANDLMIIADQNHDDTYKSVIIISASQFPKAYLPKENIRFDREEAVNLDIILSVFDISPTKADTMIHVFDILEEAQKNDTELINLHLASRNEKVGYGRIQSRILGEALVNYSKMSEATVINLVEKRKTATPGKSRWMKGELDNVKNLAVTDYYYDKAASFSVFLKPVKIAQNFAGDRTSTEEILNQIFQMFEAGKNIDELNNGQFSQAMMVVFAAFLKTVRENELNLVVQYDNPFKNYFKKETFNTKSSEIIIKNLSVLQQSQPDKIRLKGRFTALDRIRNKFTFLADDKRSFEGKFDTELFESIARYTLQTAYLVSIETVYERKSGREGATPRHTIVSCIATND